MNSAEKNSFDCKRKTENFLCYFFGGKRMNNKRLMKVLGLLLVIGLVAVIRPLTRAQARTIDAFSVSDWTIDGLVVDNSSRLVISPQSGTPIIEPIPDQTTDELEELTFSIYVTRGSSDPISILEYSLLDAPIGATISVTTKTGTTAKFEWTPTEAQGPGVYNFFVEVCETAEGNQSCATAPVSITVNEVNVAPVLAPIGNQEGNELETLTFSATATDADLPEQELVFSLADGMYGDVPDSAGINPLSGVFSWTPTEAQGPGVYTFDVCVTDSYHGQDCETITVTVNEVNEAPVANDMTVTTAEDTAKTITLDATDIDGDTLTAEILSGPSHGQVSVSGLVVIYTPNANYNGSDSFTYRVSDGELWSDPATVSITVTPLPRIYLPIIFR
jgi:hypothetical protein